MVGTVDWVCVDDIFCFSIIQKEIDMKRNYMFYVSDIM